MIKNRTLIRLLAFITAVIIFIMAVIYNGFSVFADNVDGYSLISVLGVNDTVITNEDYNNSLLLSPDSTLFESYNRVVDNNAIVPTAYYNSNYHLQNGFDNYVSLVRQDGGVVAFYPLPTGATVGVFSNSIVIFYGQIVSGPINDYNIFPLNFYGSSGQFWSNSSEIAGNQTINGMSMTVYNVATSQWKLVSSSVDVRGFNGTYDEWDKDINSLSSNFNPNSGEGGQDATNNLYFKDFNINYNVTGFTKGNVVFSGTPNDYMIEHPEEFTLVYTYTFNVDVANNYVGGWHYKTTATSNPYQIPLSTFINNGNYLVDNLADVETNTPVKVSNDTGDTNHYFETIKGCFDEWVGLSYDYSYVNWYTAKVKCSAYVVANSNTVLDTLKNHSGIYSKSYNFLTGNQASDSGNSITTNNNPYNDSESSSIDDQTQVDINNTTDHFNGSNIPSSNNPSSGNTATTNSGNITINNTNNVGTGDSTSGTGGLSTSNAGLTNTFFNTFNPLKMLFNALVGDDSTEMLSEEMRETIGENAFLQFVSSSFSFMPSSFWVDISTFFGACLVVLIIAFIFKVIISIL